MRTYSQEFRESLVRRMLAKEVGMSALARETGIAEGTLYRWRDRAQLGTAGVSNGNRRERFSGARKLAVVMETAALNEAELNEYCRKKGLHAEQVRQWREQAEQAMSGGLVSSQVHRQALQAEKRQREALERELRRKEKALAETAALLTLRKKAQAIWGEGEEE
jgi:transposase-like protein